MADTEKERWRLKASPDPASTIKKLRHFLRCECHYNRDFSGPSGAKRLSDAVIALLDGEASSYMIRDEHPDMTVADFARLGEKKEKTHDGPPGWDAYVEWREAIIRGENPPGFDTWRKSIEGNSPVKVVKTRPEPDCPCGGQPPDHVPRGPNCRLPL